MLNATYVIRKIFIKYKSDFLALGFLSLLSPLYFYKLAQSSLSSWDEAWYGDIARNIIESGNFLVLSWNGNVYSDHPPAGFWIMAFFEWIFGINEYGVRLGSAIFGLLGVYLVYLLGREVFSKVVGFSSALALSSTYWYLTRSRSGNLDIFLTVFFILTFYLAVKASKNPKFIIPLALSFALLVLTKSIIPFTLLPALVIIFIKAKLDIKSTTIAVAAFIVITIPWFITQYQIDPSLFYRYFLIGAPGVGGETDYLKNLKLTKEYLHFGVGKWFWPGVLGVFAGPVLLNKYLIALSAFCLSFFLPFISSSKGHIWHLIPLYPFMILSFFGFVYVFANFLINKFFKKDKVILMNLVAAGIIAYSLYFSWMQIKRSWYEFIDIPAFVSDEAILSTKAGKLPDKFYIDGPDFTPAAIFYSHKNVSKLDDANLQQLFESKQDYVLVTYQWRLDKYKIPKDQYKIIASDRDKILVVRQAR